MEELAIRLKYPEKIFVKESLEEEFERLMGESKNWMRLYQILRMNWMQLKIAIPTSSR